MIERIEIEIWHQVCLHIINSLTQSFQELVEVFLVQEDLVPVVSIVVKTLAAFGNGQEIIITTGCPYIKKIGPSFTSPDPLAVNTVHFFVVVLVRHSS